MYFLEIIEDLYTYCIKKITLTNLFTLINNSSKIILAIKDFYPLNDGFEQVNSGYS